MSDDTLRLNPDPGMKRWSVVTRYKDGQQTVNTHDLLAHAITELTEKAADDFIEKLELRPSW